uniref:transposase n=1 Tax=Brunnivagina elsteri TaxID=1247191 RepID=UPI0026A828ED
MMQQHLFITQFGIVLLTIKHSYCWSRNRRVVANLATGENPRGKVCAKVEYSEKEVDTRFVVTSLPINKIPPGRLYTQKYCPRGNMENCLKEQKLGLHSDRTSTHTFQGNQLRLWFASIARAISF